MRITPGRVDLLAPPAATVMRQLAVLVVLVAIGGPLPLGAARVVVTVDGPPAEPIQVEITAPPMRRPG